MAWVWAPQKLLYLKRKNSYKSQYQTPSTARITGKLDSKGVDRKWLSISCAPNNNSSKLSGPSSVRKYDRDIPMYNMMERPMALHKLYLPPTQSQNGNMLFKSMPNCETFSELVDKATKCFETASACFSSGMDFRNHFLAECALN